MKYEILGYNQQQNYFECRCEDGCEHRIDLLVDGNLHKPSHKMTNEQYLEFKKSLIGRTVTIEKLTPYIEIAHGVKLLRRVRLV